MEADQRKESAIIIGDRLHPYENEWVALDADYQVIAHAERLTNLVENLTPDEEAQNPSFLQVLPHDVSFISDAAL